MFPTKQFILMFNKECINIPKPKSVDAIKTKNPQSVRAPTALITDHQYTLRPQETLAVALKMPHLLDRDATGILTPWARYDNHDKILSTQHKAQSTTMLCRYRS